MFTKSRSAAVDLYVERGAATAGALNVRILELESSAFQSLNVINVRAAQIHQRSGVNVHLQTFEVEYLVHHAGAVLESHRILKAVATATHYGQTKPRWNRRLHSHNLFYLGNCAGSQNRCRGLWLNCGLNWSFSRGRCGGGCHRFGLLLLAYCNKG